MNPAQTQDTKKVFTNEQVLLIRTLRGDHYSPSMSYAKITQLLAEKFNLTIGMNTAQFAGWGKTYSDVQGPEGWTPYTEWQSWHCEQKTIDRRERRLAAQAQLKAKRTAEKAAAKKVVPLKDEQGKLTAAGVSKVLALLKAGKSQKEAAYELGVNASTISRTAAKKAEAK